MCCDKEVIVLNKTIEITIRNKVARQTNKTVYTCGNSDFVVIFDFDEEWNGFKVKTARFIHSAGYTDVVFEGNQCGVPIISGTHNIKVGVFAGNLSTTTPAHVGARKSILCESGTPAPPSEDAYSQLIEMIEDGCIKGDKGDPGVDGRTPVKGKDYYTDADKTEMVNAVLAALPSWEGGSY